MECLVKEEKKEGKDEGEGEEGGREKVEWDGKKGERKGKGDVEIEVLDENSIG